MTHEHHHHDHAAPKTFDARFALGAVLNLGFVAIEVVYGLLAHSVALLADAAHNFGDVLGLLLAWFAAHLARRPPSGNHTYGFGRATILASLTNAVVLLVGVGGLAAEAVRRLTDGGELPVAGTTVMVVAGLGIAVNAGTALLFASGRHGDLNIRGAFLHMAADAVVSAGVVVAGLVILLTGASWLDPVVSLAIAAFIFWSSWGLLRDSLNLAMDKAPSGTAMTDICVALRALPGVHDVHDVHDVHVWALSTTETALTAHLVHDGASDALLREATHAMHHRFGIGHVTFQLESQAASQACELRELHPAQAA